MKLPKIKIKTSKWKNNNLEYWKNEYAKIAYALTAISAMNLLYTIYHQNWILTTANTIPTITGSIIWISNNKRKKPKGE